MSFSGSVKQFNDNTSDKMDKIVRMSFLEVATRVIRRSPVGDADYWKPAKSGKIYKPKGYTGGRFRANWQASVNAPKSGTRNTTKASAATATVKAASRKNARSYFLMNNLPYATAIENGHSRQAPTGIVKLVSAEWTSIVRIVTKLVK